MYYLKTSSVIIAMVSTFYLLFLLFKSPDPIQYRKMDLKKVQEALKKEGRVIHQDEVRQIMLDKQIAIKEQAVPEKSQKSNIQAEVFRVLDIDSNNQMNIFKLSKAVYIRKIAITKEAILELTFSDSFSQVADDSDKLEKFNQLFISIDHSGAKGLRILMDSMSLSEYLHDRDLKQHKKLRKVEKNINKNLSPL